MLFNMPADQDQVADHCTDPSTLYLSFRSRSTAALKWLLPDNAENVISKYSEFKNEFIGVKLSRRKPLEIHIRLDLAVILLAFAMLMVELDHLVIRLPEVCPPGIYFDICREQILAILINGALDDFIADTEVDGLFSPPAVL